MGVGNVLRQQMRICTLMLRLCVSVHMSTTEMTLLNDIWTDRHPNKDSDTVPITGYKIKPVSTKSNITAFSISF